MRKDELRMLDLIYTREMRKTQHFTMNRYEFSSKLYVRTVTTATTYRVRKRTRINDTTDPFKGSNEAGKPSVVVAPPLRRSHSTSFDEPDPYVSLLGTQLVVSLDQASRMAFDESQLYNS
ncbi:unnamed protein product [Nippostrongylus brasiliensis]|uniref:Uncharacterized protein n=1 Tax=Nippostrongylus brasiliensis TaxID=27835 RepID=A0A0N4YAJ5_NIPBR|nr:unnamed protein product [Nippostrongylus brasiliensis]